jgi:hypothetical protein
MMSANEMKKSSASNSKKKQPRLKRIPPTAPSARDEGPRLLPLEDRVGESSRLDHYLDLADAALGLKGEAEKKPSDARKDR